MEIDLAVWAPLGADDTLRELWHATPDARGVPDGATPRRPDPAHERLEEVSVPTLVIVPAHDRRRSARSVRKLRAALTARNLSRSTQITT